MSTQQQIQQTPSTLMMTLIPLVNTMPCVRLTSVVLLVRVVHNRAYSEGGTTYTAPSVYRTWCVGYRVKSLLYCMDMGHLCVPIYMCVLVHRESV